MSRPKLPISRDKGYRLRMTDEDMKKLDYCAKETGKTKAEVIRKGIDLVYQDILKRQD